LPSKYSRPGSGKATLEVQLLLELPETREAGEPIPVLLSITGWDTTTHPASTQSCIRRLTDFYCRHNPLQDRQQAHEMIHDSLKDPALIMVCGSRNDTVDMTKPQVTGGGGPNVSA
jgi:hypothetical protein